MTQEEILKRKLFNACLNIKPDGKYIDLRIIRKIEKDQQGKVKYTLEQLIDLALKNNKK